MSNELEPSYRVSWLTGPWSPGSISMRLRSFSSMKEALGFAFERLDDPRAHNPILSQVGRTKHFDRDALLRMRQEAMGCNGDRAMPQPTA
jgi:hypothetical protein